MSLFKEIEAKPIEYLILLFIFLTALILFFVFRFNHATERWVVYATSAAYFIWSLYHHYRRGDLHLSIVIEYLIFILLAIVVTASTLF
jgi:hypothetical protein